MEAVNLPFDLEIAAEPVVNRDYLVKLQSVDVKVSSRDRRLAVANVLAGVFDTIGHEVNEQLVRFTDLHPMVQEAYDRVGRPVKFPVGDAEGCARVKVLDVEAGTMLVADGFERDLALVVAPAVTLPCGPDEPAGQLPVLSNVAAIPAGPFTLSVPVAASYGELARAMSAAFTDGKLFFSRDYPGLYLEHPELYESQGLVVLKLHMKGPVHAMGIDANLDGDIFFSGHVSVADNEISIPDLEPTIETSNFLLSLKAATSVTAIRDQARAALRLDLGDWLRQVRASLAGDLTFGGKDACLHGDIDKIEVASVHAHGTYLRVLVLVTGRAAATMPCVAAMVETPAPRPAASTGNTGLHPPGPPPRQARRGEREPFRMRLLSRSPFLAWRGRGPGGRSSCLAASPGESAVRRCCYADGGGEGTRHATSRGLGRGFRGRSRVGDRGLRGQDGHPGRGRCGQHGLRLGDEHHGWKGAGVRCDGAGGWAG